MDGGGKSIKKLPRYNYYDGVVHLVQSFLETMAKRKKINKLLFGKDIPSCDNNN